MEVGMVIIGLTGPSGSGKTTLCDIAKSLGIMSIDADKVYHALLIPPSPCLDEIAENFSGVLLDNGSLDRAALGQTVFSDESGERLSLLNSITHKYVKARFKEIIKDLRERGERAVIVDAPTLFESGFDSECDFTVAILADGDLRRERIITRDSLSSERADQRLSAQKPDDFFISRADYVLHNDGNLSALKVNFEAILRERRLL
jgi:dephospho-CoA kinase